MNPLMPVIEFSEEVQGLAHRLNLASAKTKTPPTLAAISLSGLNEDIARSYVSDGLERNKEKIVKNLAAEESRQKVLKSAGIVDDAAAIAYLNRVRPVLEDWGARLSQIEDRHREEIQAFVDGLPDL